MEIRGSNEISIHAPCSRVWQALEDSTCLPEWATTGGTRVRMEYSYHPKNVFTGILFRVMMAGKMESMRQGPLASLKQFIEQAPPSHAR